MSLHAASYFAGVGTVVATIAIGFGGGVMLTDAFVGKSERTPTLMERRAAPLSESTAPVVAVAPAPTAEQQPQMQPQTPAQTSEQPSAAPQQATVTPAVAQPPAASLQAAPQPITSSVEPTPAAPVAQNRPRFEQSMGRMQETDLRDQDVDARKAAAAERRKQERRKWAERRKRDMQKIDELAAVSEKVKQAEREREREHEPVFRSFAAERPGSPRLPVINLFGGGDD